MGGKLISNSQLWPTRRRQSHSRTPFRPLDLRLPTRSIIGHSLSIRLENDLMIVVRTYNQVMTFRVLTRCNLYLRVQLPDPYFAITDSRSSRRRNSSII